MGPFDGRRQANRHGHGGHRGMGVASGIEQTERVAQSANADLIDRNITVIGGTLNVREHQIVQGFVRCVHDDLLNDWGLLLESDGGSGRAFQHLLYGLSHGFAFWCDLAPETENLVAIPTDQILVEVPVGRITS